jgi:hypothetical protein
MVELASNTTGAADGVLNAAGFLITGFARVLILY